jgi:hypothetical protein
VGHLVIAAANDVRLKGGNMTAQGNALGWQQKMNVRPEGAR